jgi:diaminohydroxyphosphoribosylaminopyrimidine deaminase/5-amino-6-(5-phosphoribosylamino)uracil reductase
MQYALELALRGKGATLTNPMVGCVIVHQDKIIGEGWHERYGGLHAEPNAVNSVVDKSLLVESDIYVTLEPCAHFGKTPPCADLIASLKPRRLFVCNMDPNPLVAGKGLKKVKAVGTEVYTGILEQKGRWLNRRFFTFHEKKRPYVLLKWAETADGFIARENYDSKWISSLESRTLVHQWRSEEGAIMVGTNTAIHDNPQLNVRMVEGKDPLRIFIDRKLRVPSNYHFFDNSQPTVCYTTEESENRQEIDYVNLDFSKPITAQVLDDLYIKNIQSVIIEGGNQLLTEFIDLGFWDEARIFKSPLAFGTGIKGPSISGTAMKKEVVDTDELITILNVQSL